jgi:hypothetical protein
MNTSEWHDKTHNIKGEPIVKKQIMREEDYYYTGMADAVQKVREMLDLELSIQEAMEVVEEAIRRARNVEPNEDTLGDRDR